MLKIIPGIYKEGKVELLETPPKESLARIFVIFEVSEKKKQISEKKRKFVCQNWRLVACGQIGQIGQITQPISGLSISR